jgi:acyl dehydratase
MIRTFGFEDLELGQCASVMRTVMEMDVVGFAEVSGDKNPIHLNED